MFRGFTCDLQALADWLRACRIRTVAMESTGVYWIPLYQLLEQRGFEVCLVNAHSLKSVPGRKSDVSDCQWIQYLHSVGLLSASFRPPDAICAVRSLWRHRSSLLQMASEHTLHMQKALSQMNLQIHHVLSDITGVSGHAILDAVLAGERDPMRLPELCHAFVKTPHETVTKALVGDYRPEHLFTLKQSLEGYRFYRRLIADLDQETERLMQSLPSAKEQGTKLPPRTKHGVYQRNGNDPRFDLRSELYRIAGVDLTDVPGVSAITTQVILTEVGPDVSRFRHASAFASWLGLCPDKRVSGGKVLSSNSQDQEPRSARAPDGSQLTLPRQRIFRRVLPTHAGQAWHCAGHHRNRAQDRLILYHVLRTKEPYSETIFHRCDEQAQLRTEVRLRKHAAQLGFQLVPIPANQDFSG